MPDPFPDRTPDDGGPDHPPIRLDDVGALGELYDDVLDREFFEDDGLEAQMRARVRASREDARAQSSNRMAAAAKAVALLQEDIDHGPAPAPPSFAARLLAPTGPSGATIAGTTSPPPSPVMAPSPAVAPTPPTPVTPPTPAHPYPNDGGSQERVVPTAGPAAVLATVYAASAKDAAPSTTPLFELRPPVGADGEPRGDNLVIFAERLEHRDRQGRLRQRLPMRDIADVTVQRRLTGNSVVFRSRNGADMVMKGLRPEVAEEMRHVVMAQIEADRARVRPAETATLPSMAETMAPAMPPTALLSFDEADLLRKLVDLHRAGVIDERELAIKTDVVADLARAARGVDLGATGI